MSDNDYKINWVYYNRNEDSKEFSIDKIQELAYEMGPLPIKLVLDPKKTVKKGIRKCPIFKQVYQDGEYEGKKRGYAQASYEYEQKLLRQAEVFLNQQNDFNKQIEEYEQLINEYELYIEEMSTKESLTSEEEIYLKKIMVMERKLKKLK